MKEKTLAQSAVRLLFGGIITLLIIPAGCLIVLIRYVWKAMDKILDLIGSKTESRISDEGVMNDGECEKNAQENN